MNNSKNRNTVPFKYLLRKSILPDPRYIGCYAAADLLEKLHNATQPAGGYMTVDKCARKCANERCTFAGLKVRFICPSSRLLKTAYENAMLSSFNLSNWSPQILC